MCARSKVLPTESGTLTRRASLRCPASAGRPEHAVMPRIFAASIVPASRALPGQVSHYS